MSAKGSKSGSGRKDDTKPQLAASASTSSVASSSQSSSNLKSQKAGTRASMKLDKDDYDLPEIDHSLDLGLDLDEPAPKKADELKKQTTLADVKSATPELKKAPTSADLKKQAAPTPADIKGPTIELKKPAAAMLKKQGTASDLKKLPANQNNNTAPAKENAPEAMTPALDSSVGSLQPTTWREVENQVNDIEEIFSGAKAAITFVYEEKPKTQGFDDPLHLLSSDDIEQIMKKVIGARRETRSALTPVTAPSVVDSPRTKRSFNPPKKEDFKTEDTGSVYPNREDFNPILFLAEVHKNTPLPQLKRGPNGLRKNVTSQTDQLKTNAHQNFDRFVACKDTIDAIHFRIKELKMPPHLQKASEKSSDIFKSILDRKQEADVTRDTLVLVKRFNYVFSLPGSITSHISHGDYDQVIRDYQKASQLKTSNIKLFRKVFQEVDAVIVKFKESMFAQLEDPNGHIDDHKRAIRVLTELGKSKEDPAEFFLGKQVNHVVQSMNLVFSRYSVGINQQKKLIQKLITTVQENLTELWKLGGSLLANSSSALAAFQVQIKDTMNTFVEKMRTILLDGSKMTAEKGRFIRESILEIGELYNILKMEIPIDCLRSLETLKENVSLLFVQETLSLTFFQLEEIVGKYDWNHREIYSKNLLDLFSILMKESLNQISPILAQSPGLEEWYSKLFFETINNFLSLLQQSSMEDFIPQIASSSSENIAGPLRQKTGTLKAQLAMRTTSVDDDHPHRSSAEKQDKKQLAILNTIYQLRTSYLPALFSVYTTQQSHLGLSSNSKKLSTSDFDKSITQLKEIEATLIDRYILRKMDAVNTTLTQVLAIISWSELNAPTEVSGYICEVLSQLVFVHFQTTSNCPNLTNQIISSLFNKLLESILSNFTSNNINLGKFGSAQIEVDIEFMQRTMAKYSNTNSQSLINSILTKTGSSTKLEKSRKEEVYERANQKTKAIFQCLKK